VSKTAVGRNTLRRRGYAALGTHFKKLTRPKTLIFFFKKGVPTLPFRELTKEIKNLLDIAASKEYNTR
jgi:ribonuclease P protein component